MEHLTDHEKKMLKCLALLPEPAESVALELLTTINNLRRILKAIAPPSAEGE